MNTDTNTWSTDLRKGYVNKHWGEIKDSPVDRHVRAVESVLDPLTGNVLPVDED